MIFTPLPFSPAEGNEKEFLNAVNFQLSEEILEAILNEPKNKISSPNICKNCQAFLSEKLVSKEKSCYFCKTPNNFTEKELKQMCDMNEDKTYFLDLNKLEMKAKSSTNVLIVVCLDYSSSMNVTYTPQPNTLAEEYLDKNIIKLENRSFINRKELLLLNLERQLKILSDQNSKYNYQLFVITFASEVLMFGDGTKDIIEMNKNMFSDLEKCRDFGKNNAFNVFESKKNFDTQILFQKLYNKDPDGLTSLGPAVACGLGVIEALKPDLSQFYIFTDGRANNGIGELSDTDSNNLIDLEAIKVYKKLSEIGTNVRTVFHIICYSDSKSKIIILENLIESKKSKSDRINITELIPGKKPVDLTYKEDQLIELLKTALTTTADTYGIVPKLKIYSLKENELTMCKDCNQNTEKETKNTALITVKDLSNISQQSENVCCKYKVNEKMKSPIFLQIQLVYTKAKTGEKIYIVSNYSSIIRKLINYQDVDLRVCNQILKKDQFQENPDLCQNYIDMMYLCKHLGIQNKNPNTTFPDAEQSMKTFLKGFAEKNLELFNDGEKRAKEAVKKYEGNEEETFKNRKLMRNIASIEKNYGEDEPTINRKKMRDFDEEDLSRKIREKKNKDFYENKKVDANFKNKQIPKYEEEEASRNKNKEKKEGIEKSKLGKKPSLYYEEEEKTFKPKKITKK